MKKRRRSQLRRLLYLLLPIVIIVLLFAFPFSPGRIKSLETTPTQKNFIVVSDPVFKSVKDIRNKHQKTAVYFTATWCGSCKIVENIINMVAMDYPSLPFLIMDIEAYRTIANEVGVILPNAIVYIDNAAFKTDANLQTDVLKAKLNIFIDVGAFAL